VTGRFRSEPFGVDGLGFSVVVVAQYGLRQLAHSVELASFLEFCVAAVLVEVAIAFAWR